jgi:hypothetical protein
MFIELLVQKTLKAPEERNHRFSNRSLTMRSFGAAFHFPANAPINIPSLKGIAV